jgi:hypothetical protein
VIQVFSMTAQNLLSGLVFVLVGLTLNQGPAKAENPKVTRALYHLGGNDVRIVQYKMDPPTSSEETGPDFCRVVIEIQNQGLQIGYLEFKDIHPFGDNYGVFAPKIQENKDHLIFVKRGDYDGRTIVITKQGRIVNLKGGLFRIFRERYLISIYCEDSRESFSLYDLEKDLILWDTALFQNFYSHGNEFFVMFRGNRFFRLDFSTGRLTEAIYDQSIYQPFPIDESNLDIVGNCECPRK